MELLPQISCPSLIIHGEKDPMVPSFHPQYLLKHIQGSRLATTHPQSPTLFPRFINPLLLSTFLTSGRTFYSTSNNTTTTTNTVILSLHQYNNTIVLSRPLPVYQYPFSVTVCSLSRLHLMPKGKHNLHLRFAAEFNKLVEDFLSE